MHTLWKFKLIAVAVLGSLACIVAADNLDGSITISRSANSRSISIQYNGVAATLVELRINGKSHSTRTVSDKMTAGEANFSLDPDAMEHGDNTVEIRLFDGSGKVVGSEMTVIQVDRSGQAPVFLTKPKSGTTVTGPVEIAVGFRSEMRGAYVSFFVDGEFKALKNFPPHTYLWDTSRIPNGWHEVQAWVVDDQNRTFKTETLKLYVNNPSGETKRRQPEEAAPVRTPSVGGDPTLSSPGMALKGTNPTTGVAPGNAFLNSSAVVRITSNALQGQTAQMAKTKGSAVGKGTMTGQRLMLPGAATPVTPTIAQRSTMKPVSVPEMPAEEPKIEAPQVKTETVKIEAPVSAAPPKPEAPKPQPVQTPKVEAVRPPEPKVEPVTAKSELMALAGPRPVLVKPELGRTLTPVIRGSRLPVNGAYSIRFNGEAVKFDVAPRVNDGVPLTPFRHLFEHAGGTVRWDNPNKTVAANGLGNAIIIRVGDQFARVNNGQVLLELAPFIERGRVIVPLSFIGESLKLNVHYDPATGHVLITSGK